MAIQGKPLDKKVVQAMLDKAGMDQYGATMTKGMFDKMINNVLPPNPSCKDCSEQSLARLTYTDFYRDDGLSKGRYTGWEDQLLVTQPLELTHAKVESYAGKGERAATRGLKLNNSMPSSHNPNHAQNAQYFQIAIDALRKIT